MTKLQKNLISFLFIYFFSFDDLRNRSTSLRIRRNKKTTKQFQKIPKTTSIDFDNDHLKNLHRTVSENELPFIWPALKRSKSRTLQKKRRRSPKGYGLQKNGTFGTRLEISPHWVRKFGRKKRPTRKELRTLHRHPETRYPIRRIEFIESGWWFRLWIDVVFRLRNVD